MRLRELGLRLRDEKQVLRNGMILLGFAAVLVLILMKFDQVWGAICTGFSTVAPVFYGIVVAFILNVFVHFFEDIVFKPFQKCRSKLWHKAKRPLAVALAYLVVVLVIVLIVAFIIPGLIESMGVLAQTAQDNVPVYFNNAMIWLNRFAAENDLTFIQEFLKDFSWSSLLSNVAQVTTDFLSSLAGVTINVASGVFAAVMGFIFSVYMLTNKEKLLRGVKSTPAGFPSQNHCPENWTDRFLDQQGVFQLHPGSADRMCDSGFPVLCGNEHPPAGLRPADLLRGGVGRVDPHSAGAYIGAAVGVVILLLVHPLDALIFLVFLLILQQVEGNLIYPRVVGSSIGLPPVWTLFAVVFWGGVWGVPGILFGTPITAVLYRILRSSVRTRLRSKEIDPRDPPFPLPEEEEEDEENDLASAETKPDQKA